jgi:hypothetical protein
MIRLGLTTRVRGVASVSSPVVLTTKHDGSWRMCVELQGFDSATKPLPFPLPKLDELAQHLRSSNLPKQITDETRPLLTFSTHEGLFQPTRVPMGARNTARRFQAVMMEVMAGILYEIVLVYLDNLLADAEDLMLLLQAIDELFDRLKAAGLTLHLRKCLLFAEEIR